MGRRESNKREKLARINAAAYELFNEKGYENTTVREIAARAGVGFGTLFSYATEKRQLLFLLFDESWRDVSDRAFRAAEKADGLVDQLIAVFTPMYRLHARNPKLARSLIGELTFTTNVTMQGRFGFDRPAFIARIAEVVTRAAKSGEIGTKADSELVARVIFSIFSWAMREWLIEDAPVAAAGIADLRRKFELLVSGLEPTKPKR